MAKAINMDLLLRRGKLTGAGFVTICVNGTFRVERSCFAEMVAAGRGSAIARSPRRRAAGALGIVAADADPALVINEEVSGACI